MDQPGGLALNGLDHLGVAMAGSDDGNAGAAVQKTVAVDVFDDGTLAAGAPLADRNGCRKAR